MITYCNSHSKVCCSHFSKSQLPTATGFQKCYSHFSKSWLPTTTVIQKTCSHFSKSWLTTIKSLLQSLLRVTITYSYSQPTVIPFNLHQQSFKSLLQSLLQVMVIYSNSRSKVCCSHFSKSWLSIAIIKNLLQSFLQHTITYRNSHWSMGCSKIKPLKSDCSCANGGRHCTSIHVHRKTAACANLTTSGWTCCIFSKEMAVYIIQNRKERKYDNIPVHTGCFIANPSSPLALPTMSTQLHHNIS